MRDLQPNERMLTPREYAAVTARSTIDLYRYIPVASRDEKGQEWVIWLRRDE